MKIIRVAEIYRYFFYAFLFVIPFQARKVLLIDQSFYTGAFTEYATPAFYLSDAFLLLSVLSLLIFNRPLLINGLSKIKNESGKAIRVKPLLFISCLVGWFFLDSLINREFLTISLYYSLRMLEMLLLVFLVLFTCNNKAHLSSSLYLLVLSGFFQSIVAIYQFIYQHSLFVSPLLHKFTGETNIGADLPGIAKVTFADETLTRAYGTFPHPNLLGAFILFTLFLTLYIYLQHKSEHLSSMSRSRLIHPPIWLLLFLCQFFALFYSFSRSAWLAALISTLMILYFLKTPKIFVSRETFLHFTRSHFELLFSMTIAISFIVINFGHITTRLFQDTDQQRSATIVSNNTFTDRSFFTIVSRETILKHPLLGSGPGTSIFQIDDYLNKIDIQRAFEPWQYQPPHNIYILSTAETGIVGFSIFMIIIIYTIGYAIRNIVSRETIPNNKQFKIALLSILAGFLFIGLFDHYFFTLQQGRLMFWILIALLLL